MRPAQLGQCAGEFQPVAAGPQLLGGADQQPGALRRVQGRGEHAQGQAVRPGRLGAELGQLVLHQFPGPLRLAQAQPGGGGVTAPGHQRRQVHVPADRHLAARQEIAQRGLGVAGGQEVLTARLEVVQAEAGLEHDIRHGHPQLGGGLVVTAHRGQRQHQVGQGQPHGDPPRPGRDAVERPGDLVRGRGQIAPAEGHGGPHGGEHALPGRCLPAGGLPEQHVRPVRRLVQLVRVDQRHQRDLDAPEGPVGQPGQLQDLLGPGDQVLVRAAGQRRGEHGDRLELRVDGDRGAHLLGHRGRVLPG